MGLCITTAPCKQTQTYLRVEVGLPVICSAIGLKHYISLVLLFHFYSSQCIVSSTQNKQIKELYKVLQKARFTDKKYVY